MALNIPQLQKSVSDLVDRVNAYKLVQRIDLGQDHMPTADALASTVVTNANVTTTFQAQLESQLATKRTGIITDATTLSNTLRADCFGLLNINANSSPAALQPNRPLDAEFDEDPDNVSNWLNVLMDFLVRLNNVFG